MTKVKLNYLFVEWFKQTNEHLYKEEVSDKERLRELEEYVNDVLEEHMEGMAKFDLPPPEDEK